MARKTAGKSNDIDLLVLLSPPLDYFEELLKPRWPEHYVLGNTSGHFEEHRKNIEKTSNP